MSAEAIVTRVKMLESLLEATQDQVIEHLPQYTEDLRDELQWDRSLERTQEHLAAAGKRARQEIVEGHATEMPSAEKREAS